MVADGSGVLHVPGAIALEGLRVRGVGTPQDVGALAGTIPEVFPRMAVVPAVVNAHTHLDLTTQARRPFDGDFDGWLRGVRGHRGAMTPSCVEAAVQQGVRAVIAGGCAAVGDIAGRGAEAYGLRALRWAGLAGVSFAELFGMGARQSATLEAIEALRASVTDSCEHRPASGDGGGLPIGLEVNGKRPEAVWHAGSTRTPGDAPVWRVARQGLQPHAPYSASRAVFEAALRSGLPVATHVAESPDETEFVRAGSGRFRVLLEELGLWNPADLVMARHPVDWLADILAEAPSVPVVCAHCNEVDDAALERLGGLRVTVAYCPRASAYFGRRGHRYREMLERGIPVALGTDGMGCLDTPDRLSTLDEVRWLLRHDGLALGTALAMATIHGARALGLPDDPFTLRPSRAEKAGVLAVPVGVEPASVAEAGCAIAGADGPPAWIAAPESFREVLPLVEEGRYSSGQP